MSTRTMVHSTHDEVTFDDLKGLKAEGYIRDSTVDQRDGFGPEMQKKQSRILQRHMELILGKRGIPTS